MKRIALVPAVCLAALSAAFAADGEITASSAESAHACLVSGIACVEEIFPAPDDGTAEARFIRLHPAPGGGRIASVSVRGAGERGEVRSVRETGGDWLIELAAPLSLKMGFSVAYEAEGFSWKAHYDLARNMRGAVEIASPLGRALPDAKIRLAGTASPPAAAVPARGGLLALREDTPLNAEWFRAYRDPAAAGEAAWETALAGDLAPFGGEIVFWDAPVGGVENLYRFPAAATAKLSAGRVAQAQRVVRLSNDGRNGSDGVLPAGTVSLAGRERGTADWTPPGGTMEIVLDGTDGSVTLEKLPRVPDEPLPEGRRRLRFAYKLSNKSPAAAKVELHVVPATPFPWELESASAELESAREGDGIATAGVVPAGGELLLRYAVVCTVPQTLRLYE
ncbi:MAG: hypothetical protein IJS32_05165 [Kiritimatiellae bacterium]|nr:hypothetical protein [Kiritimatiellia bacterium]